MRSIFWISLAAVLVLSYNGVDSVNFDLSSCLEMKPLQMTGEPQSKPPIFKFNIEKKKYKSGDSIKGMKLNYLSWNNIKYEYFYNKNSK